MLTGGSLTELSDNGELEFSSQHGCLWEMWGCCSGSIARVALAVAIVIGHSFWLSAGGVVVEPYRGGFITHSWGNFRALMQTTA